MNSSTTPVRLGLMGCGQRTRHVVKSLLAAAKGQIQIAAMYDPDPLSQTETVSAFGSGIRNCATEEELAQSSVEWIVVGSPNSHHARQAILALNSGKNVFCEKPLAILPADCLKVQEAVRVSGRRFAFGLVLRYSPHFQKIRELVKSGVIGDPISFEFNETLGFNHGGYIFGNWRRHRALAGSHLLEKCCHDLDLANWLVESRPRRAASFGGRNFFLPEQEKQIERIGPNSEGKPAYQTWPDPHRVNPFSEGADIIDNQVAILEYENGVRATFHTNCNAGIPERRFYFCGTEGSIRADAHAGWIEWQRIGHETQINRLETKTGQSHAGGDEAMGRGLAETLLHDAPPLATAADGTLACLTAFGMDEAMDRGIVFEFEPLWREFERSSV